MIKVSIDLVFDKMSCSHGPIKVKNDANASNGNHYYHLVIGVVIYVDITIDIRITNLVDISVNNLCFKMSK